MNRRNFLESLGLAAVGGVVAYSFPKIIVPKNLEIGEVFLHSSKLVFKVSDDANYGFGFSGMQEMWPQIIDEMWFKESADTIYFKKHYLVNR